MQLRLPAGLLRRAVWRAAARATKRARTRAAAAAGRVNTPPLRGVRAAASVGRLPARHPPNVEREERFERMTMTTHCPTTTDLPTAAAHPNERRRRGRAVATRQLSSPLAEKLRTCSRRLAVSTASLCHVAWAMVLARLSDRAEVAFGTRGPAAGDCIGAEPSPRFWSLRISVGAQGAEGAVRDTDHALSRLALEPCASRAPERSVDAEPADTSALLAYEACHPAAAEAHIGRAPNPESTADEIDASLVLHIRDDASGIELRASVDHLVAPDLVCALAE